MKNINKLILALLVLIFAACGKDDKFEINTQNVVPSVLNKFNIEELVITNTTNLEEMADTWTWSTTDYGFSAARQYVVVADTSSSFSGTEIEVGSADSLSLIVTKGMLNKTASKFTAKAEPVTLHIRVKTTLKSNEFGSGMKPVYSNAGQISVTPFALSKDIIYLTGNAINGIPQWDNSLSGIGNGLQLLFADDSKADNQKYTYTAILNANGEFKLPIKAGEWNPSWGSAGSGNLILENDSKNLTTANTTELYTLSFNFSDKTYTVEKYVGKVDTYNTIGVLGSATTIGWDTDIDMTQVSPHIWLLNEANLQPGELKFRANDTWDINWGTGESQDLPFGIGLVSSDKNIKIDKSGVYIILFNDLSLNYIICEKNKLP